MKKIIVLKNSILQRLKLRCKIKCLIRKIESFFTFNGIGRTYNSIRTSLWIWQSKKRLSLASVKIYNIGFIQFFVKLFLIAVLLSSFSFLNIFLTYLNQDSKLGLDSLSYFQNFRKEKSFLNIAEKQKPVIKNFSYLMIDENKNEKKQREIIVEYKIKEKDTLLEIAKNFGISLETILWANNISKNSIIKPGQKLIILPVSGVLHIVKKGDTLSQIAKRYKGELEKIVSFNNIKDWDEISIGDTIIVPNGKMPKKKIISRQKKYSYKKNYPQNSSSIKFICPITPPCRITQGLHFYNAIDFSDKKCGGPVFSVADGKVLSIRYNQRLTGNYIKIIHSDGIVTFYGHLSKILVKKGQNVKQGQKIGLIGHTGYTIPSGPKGCHLHFAVYGGKNPFAY